MIKSLFTLEEMEDSLFRFITDSVRFVLRYYRPGTLEKIYIGVSPEPDVDTADIILKIDGREKSINYDLFKVAEEDMERDDQRECYFKEETIWHDFFDFLDHDIQAIESSMESIKERLAACYKVEIEIDVDD